jgi:hypothetical protein
MSDYDPKQDRSGNIMLAAIAFLISLPLLIGSIYDLIRPESVVLDDKFVSSFEQFRRDAYDKLTEREMRYAGQEFEDGLRISYDKIAADHWKLVADQTRRHLLMYGALVLVSSGYLIFVWRDTRTKVRRESLSEQSNNIRS